SFILFSFGIGEATSHFLAQAALHGTSGAFMNVLGSGNFDGALSGFAAGMVSSLVSSSIEGLAVTDGTANSFGRNTSLFKVTMIASGGLSGGISSSIAGGNFWKGVQQGVITSGLNHLAHQGVVIVKRQILKNRLEKSRWTDDATE